MNLLLVKYEVIEYEIQYPVETDIRAARKAIAEQLPRHQTTERTVKKINRSRYVFLQKGVYRMHRLLSFFLLRFAVIPNIATFVPCIKALMQGKYGRLLTAR